MPTKTVEMALKNIFSSFHMDCTPEEGRKMDQAKHCHENKNNKKNAINSLNNSWNDNDSSQNYVRYLSTFYFLLFYISL